MHLKLWVKEERKELLESESNLKNSKRAHESWCKDEQHRYKDAWMYDSSGEHSFIHTYLAFTNDSLTTLNKTHVMVSPQPPQI